MGELPRQICDRLVELEVSVAGVEQWLKLLGIELFQAIAGGHHTRRATSSKGYRRETCKVTSVFLPAHRALLSIRARRRCVPLHHARPPRCTGQASRGVSMAVDDAHMGGAAVGFGAAVEFLEMGCDHVAVSQACQTLACTH